MRTPWKLLSATLIAASVPWIAGSAGAAPLSASLALNSADVAAVEQVQWRWHRGRWIGPTAGFAAGVVVGSALAPHYYYDYGYAPGYSAFAYEPGYAYVPVRPYRSYGYWGYNCAGEESADSANARGCRFSR
jgi:hypothetical protein